MRKLSVAGQSQTKATGVRADTAKEKKNNERQRHRFGSPHTNRFSKRFMQEIKLITLST